MDDQAVKRNIFQQIFSWRMIVNFLLGVSSGIPLLAIGSTLQAWMTDEGVNLKTIGLFTLVGIPYTLKFLWAPVVDRFVPPFLGRRRGWMLITQLLLVLTFVGMSSFSPSEFPGLVACFAFLIAFFSASQDIVIDAYRREILNNDELGLGASLAVNGYRIGMLIAGAFALFMADHVSWRLVYILIGCSMSIGILTTLLAPNPDGTITPPRSLGEAIVQPFIDYFKRRGCIEILIFILLYKIGDVMASTMTTPFILKLGFSKTDLAAIAKTFGLVATIGGGFLGGIILLRMSMKRTLWIFGILQAVSTLVFSYLAIAGKNYAVLTSTIAFENLASGMGTAAFVAFMASLCNKRFTATQYALLSSFIGVPRVIFSSCTGFLAESMGWVGFFAFCTLIAAPGLAFLVRYNTWVGLADETPQSQ